MWETYAAGLSAPEGLPSPRPVFPERAGAPGAETRIRKPITPWKSLSSRKAYHELPGEMRDRLSRGERGKIPDTKRESDG